MLRNSNSNSWKLPFIYEYFFLKKKEFSEPYKESGNIFLPKTPYIIEMLDIENEFANMWEKTVLKNLFLDRDMSRIILLCHNVTNSTHLLYKIRFTMSLYSKVTVKIVLHLSQYQVELFNCYYPFIK